MQGYVVTTNFEYATDKTGNPYGWGLARYATPEAAFGEAFTQRCTSAPRRNPGKR